MKKYLFIAIAALGLAACAEKMGNHHSGEVENSFIAISLSATDPNTRAEGDPYQEGAADERAVETAYFFFFNENGTAFPVNVNGSTIDGPGTEGTLKNYLQASLTTTTGKDMNNVSDIKNVVLLLSNYKGEFPKKIVAVLNWVPSDDLYSLEALQNELVNVRSNEDGDLKGKFVMSNSVYAADGNAVYATPLTEDNIFTDEVNAKANPVTIYVERAAAKVTVTTAGGETKFNLNKPVVVGGDSTPVYAVIKGWELYNDYQTSHLVKNIDVSWTDTDLGFTWNDSPWFRCYWAKSQTGPFAGNTFNYEYASIPEGYKTVYGYGFGIEADVTAGTYTEKTFTYCGENTGRDAAARTKVILKAQLQKDNGDAVELARWYTTEYLGEKDLRTAVANTLKYTLYYKEEGTGNLIGITPDDLQCVSPAYDGEGNITNGAPTDIKPYQVFFQLSTDAQNKEWYKNNAGVKEPITENVDSDPKGVAETNKYLSAQVEPAVLYKSGQTYYYIDIQHLGNLLDETVQTGEYGVVRNHIYALNIKSIGGYGSPIYIGTSSILNPEYPEYPGDDEETSFVSAEVRILSWRLVSQQVNVQPTPGV